MTEDRRNTGSEPPTAEELLALENELNDQALQLEVQREELERAHRAMEESRIRFAHLFHQAPVGYVTLDQAGMIREANRTFASMLGAESDELVDKPFSDVLMEPDRGIFLSRFRAFFKRPGEKRMEARIRGPGPEGPSFHARLEGAFESREREGPEETELEPRLLLTISDISELKEAQDRVQQLNDLLRAIRNVNQLITREEDPHHLLTEACRELRESQGYHHTWIALGPRDRGPEKVYFSREGMAPTFASFQIPDDSLPDSGSGTPGGNGEGAPSCFREALKVEDGIFLPQAPLPCSRCDLEPRSLDRCTLAIRMEFGGRPFGVLGVAGEKDLASRDEELSLLKELAGDLALALFAQEERRARARVERSLQTANLVVEQSPGILFLWKADPGWPVEYVSQNISRFGFSQEDFTSGRLLYDEIIHPEDRDRVLQEVERAVASHVREFRQEYRIVTAQGATRWVQDHTTVIRDHQGAILRFQGLVVDVHEEKKATLALQAERQHLATTLDSIGDAVIVTDARGRVTRMNPVAEKLTGWHREEATGGELTEVFPIYNARTGEQAENPVARVLAEGTVVGLANHTVLRTRDGQRLQIADSAAPMRGPGGKVLGVVLVFRDVSQEYRLQEELNFQATCLAQTQDLILATDLDGTIRYVNDAECRLFGWPREAFIGKPVTILGEVGSGYPTQTEILEVTRERGSWRGRVTNRLPDGRTVLLDCRIQTLQDEEGEPMGLVGISTDITDQVQAEEERKALQQQLQQAMKMEAVGRLAGGLAHDFNNLLTSILGNVELAMEDLSPHDPLYVSLTEVSEAGESAADLTRQLLAFSRKQIIEPRALDLNGLVERSRRMLARLIGEHIRMETRLEEPLPAVRLDSAQFEQILANLAVNARDAMPEGGRLTVATSRVELGQEFCLRNPDAHPGSYVVLEVSDTGHGMTREVQERIFEPFYTTKPQGKGTGLGLATIYGAVTQIGGFIEVSSRLGKGTTFRLFFPRAEEEAEEIPSPPHPSQPPAGGEETILVVEDEKLVRGFAVKALKRAGYQVMEAADGAEALSLTQETEGPIHLLLTDVVMPRMNGPELAERLAKSRPGLRVLFTSGYTENLIAHHGILEDELDFIPKPYMPRELLTEVRRVLDQGDG